jgi:hypothetical protein
MMRWFAVALLAIACLTADANAQAPDIVFDGTARTGADTRAVRFHFFCSSNNGPNVTGALAVELEVAQYEQLRPVFDFDLFEGPDAHAGPLTQLIAAGARSKASDRFAAAGSVVPSGAFMLGVAASRRDARLLRKLAALVRPLTEGPAKLVWQQGNAKPGGPPMTATLELSKARSAQLKSGLGPCIAAR